MPHVLTCSPDIHVVTEYVRTARRTLQKMFETHWVPQSQLENWVIAPTKTPTRKGSQQVHPVLSAVTTSSVRSTKSAHIITTLQHRAQAVAIANVLLQG